MNAPGCLWPFGARRAAAPADWLDASAWTIGPVIGGKNYSKGVPLHPRQVSEPGRPFAGFSIDIPFPDEDAGSVHYVTAPCGSLAGKTRLSISYRIDADPGTRIYAASVPGAPSMLSLYFQRRGDDWSGTGKYARYRWYAGFARQEPITPGASTIVAPFTGPWGGVSAGSDAAASPQAFADALAEADTVGFVLGGGSGLGHGVYATGPARLTVTDFRVE